MSISNELQIGKAAEHLVVADLILQGYNAFLTDPSAQYDVLVDCDGRLIRIQVKSTMHPIKRYHHYLGPMYRFAFRRAKGHLRRFEAKDVDWIAFVALDLRIVAYLPIEKAKTRNGNIKTIFDFKSRTCEYRNHVYTNGTVRKDIGKYLEDYQQFQP